MKLFKLRKDKWPVCWYVNTDETGQPEPLQLDEDVVFDREEMLADPVSLANKNMVNPSYRTWAEAGYAVFERKDEWETYHYYALPYSEVEIMG
jgi:hypothetical protein